MVSVREQKIEMLKALSKQVSQAVTAIYSDEKLSHTERMAELTAAYISGVFALMFSLNMEVLDLTEEVKNSLSLLQEPPNEYIN